MLLKLGLAFVTATTASLYLTPRIRDHAIRRGVLDRSDGARKIHRNPTPRLGGLAIVVGFYLAVAIISFVTARRFTPTEIALLAAGLGAALLGVFDDLRNADARVKLVVQGAIAVASYAAGLRIQALSLPFAHVSLGWFGFPVTVVWMVGITNAVNLIDGLDGLASGIALVALTAMTIMPNRSDPDLTVFIVALIGAVSGFLAYNRHPASIFMGDSGSLFLGMMLAVLSVRSAIEPGGAVWLSTPVLLLAVPIFDTAAAVVRRLCRGGSPFKGDSEHVHHRFMKRLGSHGAAVGALVVVAALFACVAVVTRRDNSLDVWLAAGTPSLLTLGLLILLMRPATGAREVPLATSPSSDAVSVSTLDGSFAADSQRRKPRRRRRRSSDYPVSRFDLNR